MARDNLRSRTKSRGRLFTSVRAERSGGVEITASSRPLLQSTEERLEDDDSVASAIYLLKAGANHLAKLALAAFRRCVV